MTLAAIVQIIQGVKRLGRFLLLAAGSHPVRDRGRYRALQSNVAAAVLTLVLAFSLTVSGIVRAWSGIRLRHAPGWGWMVELG